MVTLFYFLILARSLLLLEITWWNLIGTYFSPSRYGIYFFERVSSNIYYNIRHIAAATCSLVLLSVFVHMPGLVCNVYIYHLTTRESRWHCKGQCPKAMRCDALTQWERHELSWAELNWAELGLAHILSVSWLIIQCLLNIIHIVYGRNMQHAIEKRFNFFTDRRRSS